ncbi:MAG: choice-of-anchor J domain-containing protein, partial [Balneolales bacterium]|nr:choice-of-anchor J domain-containing protein [Balneolales bacterium]
MNNFHYSLKEYAFVSAVLLLVMCLFPVSAFAQSSGTSLTAERERNTLTIGQNGVQTPDRQAIVNRFSQAEIEMFSSISPEVFSTFTIDELSLIGQVLNKQLTQLSATEQALMNRVNELAAVSRSGSLFRQGLLNSEIVWSTGFEDGIPDGWSVTDNSGTSFVWETNQPGGGLTGEFTNFVIADSDAAGSGAGNVNTTLTTDEIDISGLSEVSFIINHSYRHLGSQRGRVEWSLDNDNWQLLVEYAASTGYPGPGIEQVYDITEAVAGNQSLWLRFVFDDASGWNWWWAIDEVMIAGVNAGGGGEDFVFEIPEVPFAGGEFEAIDEMFSGQLFALDPDFFPIDMQGGTWTNDFALLFIDGDFENGERVLQVGGFTNYGAATRVSWSGGSNGTDPVTTFVELAQPLDMDGLTVYYGNGWNGSPTGTWGGTIEFILEADEPEPVPGEIVWEQTINGTNGIVSGFFADLEGGTGAYSADDFGLASETEITVITVNGFYANGFTPSQITNTGWYIFPDAGGVPAGNPETSPEAAVWSYVAEQGDDALVLAPGGNISLNVFELDDSLVLPAGQYWLAFHTSQAGTTAGNIRWNWYAGAPEQLEVAKIITPGAAFGGAFPEWADLTGVNPAFAALAFSLTGIADDTPPVDDPVAVVDPASLSFSLGEGSSDSQDLELSNAGGEALEFSIVVENAAARAYNPGIRSNFATVEGGSRYRPNAPSNIQADANVQPAAGLMAIDELAEGFADVTTLPGAGWSIQNLSNPAGSTSWSQGSPGTFPAFSGEPNHYISANFNNTTGNNTINSWLITPEVTLQNGTELRFYTRRVASQFQDRLQVRMSTEGSSTNAGSSPENVGDFATLLLDINPNYSAGGYPEEWTEYVLTVEGLSGATTGRFAFRYFVESGGPSGNNSDYIGIDEVSISQPNGNGDDPQLAISVSPTEGSVAPGGAQNLLVSANTAGLTPGNYDYNIRITSNDPANGLILVPVALEVSPAVTGPVLTLSSSSLAFGAVVEGFDRTLPLTFTNTGTSNLTVLSVSSDNSAFTTTFGDAFILAPGASSVIDVTFAPGSVASFSGTLTVNSTSVIDPVKTVALSGQGVDQPIFAVDPEEFELTLAADASTTFDVTITNDGSGILEFAMPNFIMDRILNGNDRAMDAVRNRMIRHIYSVEDGTAEAAQANYERFILDQYIRGTLNRTSPEIRELIANYEAAKAEQTSSNVKNSRANTADAGLMSDDGFLIEFEALTLTGAQFITVAFDLNGELTEIDPDFVIDAAEGGTWASDFGILFTTVDISGGGTIDPATVVLQVGGFTNYGATPRINWIGGTTGTPGTPVNEPVVIPTPLDVSGLYVSIGNAWTTSPGGTWTGSITLKGVAGTTPFITSASPASGSLAAGESQVVELTIDAAGLIGGEYMDILEIVSNDPETPEFGVVAMLTVEGTPEISVSPESLAFGEVVVGESASQDVTVTNTGSDVLVITAAGVESDHFSVEGPSTAELPVGESLVYTVTFAPVSSGAKGGEFIVESNGGTGVVSLSGDGVDPGVLEFDPSSLVVEVNQGSNGTVSFTLSNVGVAPLNYSLGGGLVAESSRLVNPVGEVTEVESAAATQSRHVGSSKLSLNTTPPASMRPGRGNMASQQESSFINRSILNDEVVLTHSVSQVVEPLNGVRCGSAAGTAANS